MFQLWEEGLVIVNCSLKLEIVKKEVLPLSYLMLYFDLSGHLTRIRNSGLSSSPGPLDHDGGALPRTGHPIPTAARELQAVQLGATCVLDFWWTPNTASGELKAWPLLHQVKNNVLLVVNFHISQLLSVLRSSQIGLPVNYFYTKISCSSLYKNKWTSDIKLKGKQRCWVLNILRAGEKSVNRFINVFFSAEILQNACNSLQLTGCWFCRKKRFLSPLTPSHSCSLFWLLEN